MLDFRVIFIALICINPTIKAFSIVTTPASFSLSLHRHRNGGIIHGSIEKQLFMRRYSIKLSDLFEMDIVSFRVLGEDSNKVEFGAVQEYGTVAPICTWTMESVMNGSDTLEFLVDEERPRYGEEEVEILSVMAEDYINGYGSRQVGGGKGLGNPHGEESEALYFIERDALSDEKYSNIEVVVKPELEILW